MSSLFEIQRATMAARNRLSDKAIGTRVDRGMIQVVRVTYPAGLKAKVSPVSEWMPVAKVCGWLDSMQ